MRVWPGAPYPLGATWDGAGVNRAASGATDDGVLDAAWRALKPGGRIVVHGVTLQTEQVLTARHAHLGGELTRLHVEHVEPLGSFTGWKPSRAIVQWAATKPAGS